jgi:hypothetical protein
MTLPPPVLACAQASTGGGLHRDVFLDAFPVEPQALARRLRVP